MPIGKLERWADYLGFNDNEPSENGAFIDQSDMDSLVTRMPPVYFHIDPESLDIDYGFNWSSDAKKGAKRFVPLEEDETAEPNSLYIPHTQKADTGITVKGLVLRFDDLVRIPSGGLDTATSLKALHNMALPFIDPRSHLVVTKKYDVRTSRVLVFYVSESDTILGARHARTSDFSLASLAKYAPAPERDPETGEIKDKGHVKYFVKQIDTFETTSEILVDTSSDIEKVTGSIAPHPLLLNLGGPISNFVCVITKMEHVITRVRYDGKIQAATVKLDLDQYDQQTLQMQVKLGTEERDEKTPSKTVKSLFFVRGEQFNGDQRRIDPGERSVTFYAQGDTYRRYLGGQ